MLAKTPDFPGFLRLQPFDLAFPKRRKRELVGGFSGRALKAIFHPEYRDTDTCRSSPPQPTKKVRRPFPDSLVPYSLVPAALAPQRTDFSRHGSHRCCGKAGGGRRLQRTGSVFTPSGPCGLPSPEGQNGPRKPLDSVRKNRYYFLHERQNEITSGS
jgi:hypothetical protein